MLLQSFLLLAYVTAIRFKLEPSNSAFIGRGTCLTYRIPEKQIVSAQLTAEPSDYHSISVHIYGRDGSQPISLRDLSSETPVSFLSIDKQNEYDVCFRATTKPRVPGQQPPPSPPPANILYTVGVTLSYVPDSFDKLAAEEKWKPAEADFIVSEQRMHQVADELSTFLKSEERLRDVNESILERVTWLSLISILSLVAIGVWQIYYLKRYFRTKKLI